MSNLVVDRRQHVGFTLSPRTVFRMLGGSSVLLAVASYVMHLIQRSRGVDAIALFDVGDEVSVGTWFEATLFLVAAIALAALAR